MKKVLVIGKRGLIGHKLLETLEGKHRVIGVGREELDTTSAAQCYEVIKEQMPDVVINATGFLNADRCQEHYKDSYRVNTAGVLNIVDAIEKINKDIKFIHFSSDFVFDGVKGGYTETDVPNPLNVYGVHKWLADELVIRSNLTRYYIFRVASVIGFNPWSNNFLKAILPIAHKKGEISIVNDIRINLTTTKFISEVVGKFIDNNYERGLYNCVSTGVTSWFNVAKFARDFLELDFNMKTIRKNDFAYKAPRSLDSTLNNQKLIDTIGPVPGWSEILTEHLITYKNQYLSMIRGEQ